MTRSNSQGLNEYNPFYNESYDEPGRRFKVDDERYRLHGRMRLAEGRG